MTQDELDLLGRLRKRLPKRINAEALCRVGIVNGNSGKSYWVYLRTGYRTRNGDGCHVIHRKYIKSINEDIKCIASCDEAPGAGYV